LKEKADRLTHINEAGEVHMVDVGAKPKPSARLSRGESTLRPETVDLIRKGLMKKGMC
jgi:cyclic pyranopterin phosphate synthase